MIDTAFTIDTLLNITEKPAPAVGARQLWRVLHDYELPGGVRDIVIQRNKPQPEVFSCFPNQFTPLNRAWQWLWRDLNAHITDMEWRKLLSCHRAFTNNCGYDCSENKHGPFADFVNGKDIGTPLPKIETLLCGGAIVTGTETTYKGVPMLQLDALDGKRVPPSVEWLRAREWLWYKAVSVAPDGAVRSFSISPFPEYVPLIASQFPVYFPLSGLRKIEG